MKQHNMSAKSNRSVSVIFIVLSALLSSQAPPASALNILGIFTSPSPSHVIVHMSVAKALAEKGHNVTIISGLEPKVTDKRIHQIIVPPTPEQSEMMEEQMAVMANSKNNVFSMILKIFGQMGMMIDMQADVIRDERVQALYKSGTKFDVVIMGYFMNEFNLGVAAKLNCPVIVEWTSAPMEMVNTFVGNPREISYVPGLQTSHKSGEPLSFVSRLQNWVAATFFQGVAFLLNFKMERHYKELFGHEENFPTLSDMKKNVSLLFVNSHFSEGPIRPNVPALIEIGGIQIKERPDPLPKQINDFLNSTTANKYGAILFTLGSNIRGSTIKPETVEVLFNVFKSLKQNVIWKWDDLEKTPGKSSNILYTKWLPQDDILAHPNVKLFITHAGKGGVTESMYHGVPMLALPIFADQHSNAQKMVDAGYGLTLDLLKLTEPELQNAIKELLNNSTYTHNVQSFSKLYRDRPLSAKESVVYWTEYVARHHGAKHMQSPLVHMGAIASKNLDLYAFIILVLYGLWRFLKFSLKFGWKKIMKKGADKNTAKKTKPKEKKVKSQ